MVSVGFYLSKSEAEHLASHGVDMERLGRDLKGLILGRTEDNKLAGLFAEKAGKPISDIKDFFELPFGANHVENERMVAESGMSDDDIEKTVKALQVARSKKSAMIKGGAFHTANMWLDLQNILRGEPDLAELKYCMDYWLGVSYLLNGLARRGSMPVSMAGLHEMVNSKKSQRELTTLKRSSGWSRVGFDKGGLGHA